MPKPAKRRKAAWEDMMKQSIFEATVEVMKEHGPAGIRMDRVARAADMATGTLYNYFKDKDALLLHVIDSLFEPYHEELLSVVAGKMSPPDKLEAYFRLTCRSWNEQRDIITILMQAKDLGLKPGKERNPEKDIPMKVIQVLCEIIKEGIAKGVFRKCDPLQIAAMIFGAMDGFLASKIAGLVSQRPLEKDIESCRALLLPGLLAPS